MDATLEPGNGQRLKESEPTLTKVSAALEIFKDDSGESSERKGEFWRESLSLPRAPLIILNHVLGKIWKVKTFFLTFLFIFETGRDRA